MCLKRCVICGCGTRTKLCFTCRAVDPKLDEGKAEHLAPGYFAKAIKAAEAEQADCCQQPEDWQTPAPTPPTPVVDIAEAAARLAKGWGARVAHA